MNTTFWTWLAVAALVGGVLLLLLSAPVAEETGVVGSESVIGAESEAVQTSYWEPAATPVVAQHAAATHQSAAACPSCGATRPAAAASTRVSYSTPSQPCGVCGAAPCATAAVTRQPSAACYCSPQPVSPCGPTACSGLATYGVAPCWNECPLTKPGINRNMNLCVDECAFVQLHTTIPYPVCSDVRFEWAATKGSFLDPRASDPIYYAPPTRFPAGEDVWIVVTITDGTGAQYSDQIQLHIMDRR